MWPASPCPMLLCYTAVDISACKWIQSPPLNLTHITINWQKLLGGNVLPYPGVECLSMWDVLLLSNASAIIDFGCQKWVTALQDFKSDINSGKVSLLYESEYVTSCEGNPTDEISRVSMSEFSTGLLSLDYKYIIRVQAVEALRVVRGSGSHIFRQSTHTWRQGCQSYAPAAF
jgi:hypothetical protein